MMKYYYKDLGLSNTEEMFRNANENGYAVPAFNFNNMEQLLAIIEACAEEGSPVILQCSSGARNYMGKEVVPMLAKSAVEIARSMGTDIPIALNLDHGADIETIEDCINYGFSSVMIDGSHCKFEENIKLSKSVADIAHKHDVSVEAELGILAGVEEDIVSSGSVFTHPDEAKEFIERTGVDSLAIAIGTSHGAHKFKPGTNPKLRIDILHEIEKEIPGFPIVLHGSSAVPKKYVDIIRKYGGTLTDAVGIPDSELRKATNSAVAKINVDTDGRLAFVAGIRETLMTHKSEYDLRKILKPGMLNMKEYYKEKIKDVFGSVGAYKKGNLNSKKFQ